MKKITKRILIASAVTAGTGVVFMGVGIALGGWPGLFLQKAESIHRTSRKLLIGRKERDRTFFRTESLCGKRSGCSCYGFKR